MENNYVSRDDLHTINRLIEQYNLEHGRRITELEHDMIIVKEQRQHTRRNEDETRKMIKEIQETVILIERNLFSYRSVASTAIKTTIAISTFFSVLIAAAWALVTEIIKI